MEKFKALGLSDKVLQALADLKFETPTDIQEQAIPRLMEGNIDLVGLAQTGTGKTAAFGLPLIDLIDTSTKETQGLILAPTRELGKQIAEQLNLFSKHMDKIHVLPVYGGAPIQVQIKALKRGQQIVIATPGRLIDLIKRRAIELSTIRYVILDEADEMLNMGFKEDLDEILSYTPKQKNTWLFSATMPQFIKRIVKTYMRDPVEIAINPKEEINSKIRHRYVIVKPRDKTEALKRFLDIHSNMRGIVFCRTKRDTQNLAEMLLQVGYKVDAIHGDLSQAQRDRVMGRFKKNELQVLIATDVAARGIDVNDLSHVFHFTLPDDVPYYTHRSGRTARAGKKGVSISFVGARETHRIRTLENALKVEFKRIMIPDNKEVVRIRIKKWCTTLVETKAHNKIDDSLKDESISIFKDLSKEELIAKLISQEYDKLHVGSDRDLNTEPEKGGGGGGRGGRRGGSRGGGGRGGYRGGRRSGSGGGGGSRRRSDSRSSSSNDRSGFKRRKKQ